MPKYGEKNEIIGLNDETGYSDYQALKESIGTRAVARRLELNKDTPRKNEKRWEDGHEVDLRTILAYRALRLAVETEERIHAKIEDCGPVMAGWEMALYPEHYEGPFVGDRTLVAEAVTECLEYAESCGLDNHETDTMRAFLATQENK